MTYRTQTDDDVCRFACLECTYVHYENPKILVACILFLEDRLLWIKRATEPYAGRWAMPAGFVELGETVEEAACRELHEETGLVLAPSDFAIYGIVSVPEISQVYISLIAPLPSMNFRVTAESSEVKLASESEIDPDVYAYPPGADRWVRLMYKRLRSGEFSRTPAILRHVRAASS